MSYYDLRHYECHKDLTGRKIPIGEIERELSTFNLRAAILLLSQMNILLAKGRLEDKDEEIQGLLRQSFFDPETNRIIDTRPQGEHYPCWFTRLLVLSMMRLCARVCFEDEAGRLIDSPEDRYEFGRCCMYVTDYLETEEEIRSYTEGAEDEKQEAITHVGAATLDLSMPTDLLHAITRADIILSEVINLPEVRERVGDFDLARAFFEATGLTHEQFRDFVFIIIAWFDGQDIEELIRDSSKFIIHRQKFIGKTSIDGAAFDKLIELISVPIQELRQYLNEQPGKALSRDFSLFALRPLLALPDGFVACLDLDFLVGMLHAGIYETVDKGFPYKQRNDGLDALGHLFEGYINRVFHAAYPPTGSRLIVAPFEGNLRYQGKGNCEPFDGIFIPPTDPRQAIVFQDKSQYLRPKYKYAADKEEFWREVDEKFGASKKKSGVTQLVDNIERVWHRDESKRKKLVSPDLLMIERVTPILIVQESWFRFPFFNWWLNRRFQGLLAKAQVLPRVRVDPLIIVDIDSLELLEPYLQAGLCSFEQPINSLIFDDRNKECLMPFHRHVTGFLSQFKTVVRDEAAINRFGQIMERIRPVFIEPSEPS